MKQKIIFWLGSDLTHYCLAYFLQQKIDADFYAIIDITDKPKKFFETQNLVKFKKIWFVHDYISKINKPDLDYLSEFEKKFTLNLWKLAINERIFYRFYNFHKFKDNEILSILENSCKLFEKILNDVKPTIFITKEPTFHHLELFYQLCKVNDVRTLMLSTPNIGYRCIISEKSVTMDEINELSKVTSSNRTFEELQTFLKTFDLAKQIKNYDISHGNTNKDLFSAALNFLSTDNSNLNTHYNYFGRTKIKVISNIISSYFKRNYRSSFLSNKTLHDVPVEKPFVYFPMAVDLERNLLVGAPFYTNQIEIIRILAKSIPINYDLIVKEAPGQLTRDWRNISEYNEILNIPNVKLLHPSVPASKIFPKCKLVVTIGGTSGLEAAAYGKASIVFTDVGYVTLPSVFKINSIDSIPELIQTALNYKVIPDDLDRFLNLLENNSFEFDWMGFGTKFKNFFYHGGNLVDVEISSKEMESFLKKSENELKPLVENHVKKILDMQN